MGKGLVSGTILGGIILFVWMAISWMVIPWHCATFKKFADENSVASIITANTKESGIYVLPYLCEKSIHSEQDKGSTPGPMVFSAVRKGGYDFASPRPYVISFIIDLIGAFVVTYLLLQARTMGYWSRVGFVTLFGIGAGVLASFPNWNWWGFDFSFALVGFLDFVIGWFLAGLCLAAVTKRV